MTRIYAKDVLKLEIERDPTGSELLNLVPNPTADGAWGWTTPVDNTRFTTSGGVFTFTTTVSQPAWFTSDIFGISPSDWVAAAWEVTGGSGVHRARFEWLDTNKDLIYRSDFTGYMDASVTTRYAAAQAASGAAYARIRFELNATIYDVDPTAGQTLSFQNPRIVAGSSSPITLRTNLIINPSFETDVTGWVHLSGTSPTPITPTRVSGGAQGSWSARTQHVSGSVDDLYPSRSDAYGYQIPVTPSTSYTFSIYSKAVTTARQVGILVVWRLADGSLSPASAPTTSANNTSTWTRMSRTLTSPSNAVAVYPTFEVSTSTASEQHLWDGAMVEAAGSLGSYIEGTVVVSGSLPTCPSVYYTPVIGELTSVSIKRPELDLGTMEVNLASNTLDPAINPLIRPGRRVKLSVTPNLAAPTVYSDLFLGVIDLPKTTYDLAAAAFGDTMALTNFTASDAVSRLANTGQPNGVGTVANLPATLEGAATKWVVNGSTDQVASATVVAIDDNASVLDQIVRTRDSVHAYAWVDRHGVLQAWDAASISATVVDTLDETVYNPSPVFDYDYADVINSVSVVLKDLLGNETTYGPFIDPESVRKNRPRTATFTIQGVSPGTIASDFAQDVLGANATAVRRAESVTIEMNSANIGRSILDLYDLVNVSNTLADIDTDLRIVGIEHAITGDEWLMTLTFLADGKVAAPTVGTPVQSSPTWVDSSAAFRVGPVLICSGEVTITVSASTQGTAAVTFGEPFSATPYLAGLCIKSISSTSALPVTLRTSGSVSTTGFTAVANVTSGSYTIVAGYHAIGPA